MCLYEMMYSVFKNDMTLALCNMLSDQDEHIRREALKPLAATVEHGLSPPLTKNSRAN